MALPFFLVPAALAAVWYLVGCGVWAELHGEPPALAPNVVNLVALGYGILGVVIVAWTYENFDGFIASAFWYGALVGIPWGVLALVNGLFIVLELVTDLVFATPDWGELGKALAILSVAVVPSITFLAAGWLARKGYELLRGRIDPAASETGAGAAGL